LFFSLGQFTLLKEVENIWNGYILSSNIWNYMGNSTILIYGMDSNGGEYEGDMIH
jgi:hypothetical protein